MSIHFVKVINLLPVTFDWHIIILSWLKREWAKSTLMIAKGEGGRGIPEGTAVLLRYKKSDVLITNKHIIRRIDNPLILFNDKSEKMVHLSTAILNLNQIYGLNWHMICHSLCVKKHRRRGGFAHNLLKNSINETQ